jgi:hypothetical protein
VERGRAGQKASLPDDGWCFFTLMTDRVYSLWLVKLLGSPRAEFTGSTVDPAVVQIGPPSAYQCRGLPAIRIESPIPRLAPY